MFTNINEVEGRLAKFDLDSGIPLTQKMLADSAESLSGTGSLEALVIPRGMVVLAVPLDRLSNSYPLQAGDHVNVIVTLKFVDVDSDFQSLLPNNVPYLLGPDQAYADGWKPLTDKVETEGYFIPTVGKTEVILGIGQTVYAVPSEVQRPRMVSHNLLQNAVVLNVGNYSETLRASEVEVEEMQPEQPVTGEETPTPTLPDPDFLSLIINPQDAVTLNYLLSSGAQLTLVLRSAEDDSRVQTEAVTLQYLLNQYNIPVPVKLPYSLEPRVDLVTPLQFEYTPPPTPEQE
jgi:hypothetical protein